jgi:hypothetical protein
MEFLSGFSYLCIMEKQTIYEFEVKKYLTKVFKDSCQVRSNEHSILDDQRPPIDHLEYVYNSYAQRWEIDETSLTEDTFQKNYGNPISTVQMKKLSLFVKKTDNKLTLIYFFSTRIREVGKKYFKIQKNAYFVTYNYKTHDTYCGSLVNYHKKRKCVKTIKRNFFADEPFNRFGRLFINFFADFYTNNKDQKGPSEVINEAFNVFRSNIPNNTPDQPLDLDKLVYFNYLQRKGIKYPNNWFVFNKMFPLAQKKELSNNDFKLVDIFMKRNQLKGDRIRKILHQIKEYPNINSFKFATGLFGYDFIIQKPDQDIIKIFEASDIDDYYSHWAFPKFSKKELNNIYGVYKHLFDVQRIDFNTFLDHLRFYTKVNVYEPIQWKSNDLKTFHEEHLDWSDKVEFYTNNKIQRIYDDIVVKMFENPIQTETGIYQPKVLLKSSEYNEESSYQNHCVKTYSKTCSSFIVSVRKDNERATLEFKINKTDDGHLTLKRVQTRGRFNANLDEKWNEVLDTIDGVVNQINKFKLFKTNEIDVFLSNNQIKRVKSKVVNLGYLDWAENINGRSIINEPDF